MSILPRSASFRRFVILLIAPLVGAIYSPSPAMATLCDSAIMTVWTSPVEGPLGNDDVVATSDPDFTGECLGTPSGPSFTSVYSGTFDDNPAEAFDTFEYQIFATDDDKLEIWITATDGERNGPNVEFPDFTLVLSDLWGEVEGIISAVDVTSSDFTLLKVFTDDTITFTFAGLKQNCGEDECFLDFHAFITITAEHVPGAVIPEPTSLALFLMGLAGLGFAMPRRRRLV